MKMNEDTRTQSQKDEGLALVLGLEREIGALQRGEDTKEVIQAMPGSVQASSGAGQRPRPIDDSAADKPPGHESGTLLHFPDIKSIRELFLRITSSPLSLLSTTYLSFPFPFPFPFPLHVTAMGLHC